MTFLVSFARPDVALLASDTRTTIRPAIDAPATSFTDGGCKLFRVGTGWLASGPSVAWRDALLAGTPPAAAIRALEPAEAQIIRERQLTMRVDARGRHVTDWGGVARFADVAPSHSVALCPNGSDPAVVLRLLDVYQAHIRGATLPALLAVTEWLYAAVYEHCGPQGTISPCVTIGLAWPDGRRSLEVRPSGARALVESTIAEGAALC